MDGPAAQGDRIWLIASVQNNPNGYSVTLGASDIVARPRSRQFDFHANNDNKSAWSI